MLLVHIHALSLVILLDACVTLVLLLMHLFLILSFFGTLHFYLNIVTSFVSFITSFSFVVAQVSVPYNIASLTTML